MKLKEVRESALMLSTRSRAKLASELILSLDEKIAWPERTEKEWKDEIARRIADLESGKDPGIPWEEVRDRTEKRINGRKTDRRRREGVRSGG